MCPICDVDPTSHSFFKMGRQKSANLFYTCPGDATNHETEGVLAHYRDVLERNDGEKWIFIFDAKGFTLYHTTRVASARGLMTIFNEYGDHLEEVRIINANRFVKAMFGTIRPFVSSNTFNKIVWK
tara:strand:+ start:1177 stop:1554 length:378 start_codon:yes stop_codon:yes gene_type:complete